MKVFVWPLLALLFVISCRVDDPIQPKLPSNDLYAIVPAGWPQPVYQFDGNEITEAKFKLGRALFYEEKLSSDNSISCGNCHQQFVAFANAEHALSHGVNDLLGHRNAPALFNLNWHPYFTWDGGVNNLEVQPLVPIADPHEMGESLSNVVNKLASDGKYTKLFKDAYGDETVNSDRMLKSLAVFTGLMYSYNSKYDKHRRGESGGDFSTQESNGYTAFQTKCAACHVEPLLTDYEFRDIGLAIDSALQDSGRMHITGNPNDRNRFKTPSLRNVMLTSPYTHDGRFETIDEVLTAHEQSVDTLSSQERSDIKAFLYTLTDYEFIKDERFKDPGN